LLLFLEKKSAPATRATEPTDIIVMPTIQLLDRAEDSPSSIFPVALSMLPAVFESGTPS
jgi:hypothetical protein